MDEIVYSEQFKEELDKRYTKYKNYGIVLTREAMENRIKNLLSKE